MDQIAALAWIDLETSGTDENMDPIIEFAMMVTRPDLTPISPPLRTGIIDNGEGLYISDEEWYYQSVVKFEYESALEAIIGRIEATDPVREMHTANGLLDELRLNQGKSIGLIDQEVCAILKAISKPRKSVMIAGSGVGHFDRRFIAKQMPQLDARLWYPAFDIGVFRRMLQAFGLSSLAGHQGPKTHRALDDVRDHIAEAHHYKTILNAAHTHLVDQIHDAIS